jgi:hypothetical protein
MDWADWFLLTVAVIYFLFNIKNIYLFIVYSFQEHGKFFTSGLLLFAAIWIMVVILAFTAPQYGWIARWSFIIYIVAFIVYRLIFGVRDKEH